MAMALLPTAFLAVQMAHAQDHNSMSSHGSGGHKSGHSAAAHNAATHSQHMAMGANPHAGAPVMPGQDAFGAIQEILAILEADPKTDWSKVNLTSLRDHLVDMNLVTLNATVKEKRLPGGLEMTVTGTGRTKEAIQRMAIAHAPEVNKLDKWTAKAKRIKDGAVLTVTAKDKKEIQKIQAIGFFGIMASGAHHQMHHLGMARGEMVHHH